MATPGNSPNSDDAVCLYLHDKVFWRHGVMTRLVVLAVVIFCSGAVTLTQEALLSLDAAKIQAGQSVKLKWNIGNADKVFISEVGKFTSDGAQTVTPDKTTTYTLIAEGKFGIVSKTITLVVEG